MPFVMNPITGKLDQVSDLSGYVPYTGATSNVNLNAKTLSNASSIQTPALNPTGSTLTIGNMSATPFVWMPGDRINFASFSDEAGSGAGHGVECYLDNYGNGNFDRVWDRTGVVIHSTGLELKDSTGAVIVLPNTSQVLIGASSPTTSARLEVTPTFGTTSPHYDIAMSDYWSTSYTPVDASSCYGYYYDTHAGLYDQAT